MQTTTRKGYMQYEKAATSDTDKRDDPHLAV